MASRSGVRPASRYCSELSCEISRLALSLLCWARCAHFRVVKIPSLFSRFARMDYHARKRTMGRRMRRLIAAIVLALMGTAAQAQYPSRPVTIVVQLAAGSGMETLVRLYGDKLAQSLGKPVVVENRPGASLMLAANAVAAAPPD